MGKLTPILPLSGFHQKWPGLEIKEAYDGELVSLACAYGHEKAFAAVFKKAYGTLPAPREMTEIKGGYAFWTGQGQYMLLLSGDNAQADKDVAAVFKETAYSTLQTDGWASLHIQGQKIHDVLERFTALDLRSAPQGFAARTSAHHIAAIFLKFGETDIRVFTPRSSAQSFLDALTHVSENTIGIQI